MVVVVVVVAVVVVIVVINDVIATGVEMGPLANGVADLWETVLQSLQSYRSVDFST